MATYGKEFKWNPPRRKKQRYALIERVVDFSKLPQTAGTAQPSDPNSSVITTAWAADDILQAFAIRAGQTVMGVQVETITASEDSGDRFQIGYGANPSYWGEYSLYRKVNGSTETGYKDESGFHNQDPLYFSTPDTVDIKVRKAALVGKVRIILHILEDDR
jgi:hypothetical protein